MPLSAPHFDRSRESYWSEKVARPTIRRKRLGRNYVMGNGKRKRRRMNGGEKRELQK